MSSQLHLDVFVPCKPIGGQMAPMGLGETPAALRAGTKNLISTLTTWRGCQGDRDRPYRREGEPDGSSEAANRRQVSGPGKRN